MGKRENDDDRISDIHSSSIDVDNRTIYLQEKEDSSETTGVDFRMVQTFIKNINILQSMSLTLLLFIAK